LEGGYILVNPGHGKIMNGPLGTDGILTAYTPDGTMLVVEGTHGSINGNTIVHADTPVTVLVEGMRISFTATSTTRIHVRTEQRVRRVLLNGKEIKNWSRNNRTGLVSATLPEGNGTITFEE
jgi:hypothetical protein